MEIKFNSEKNNKDKQRFSYNSILSFVAFIAIGCIAIAILLTLIFKNNSTLSNSFRSIGEAIAYVVSIVLAFSWVKTHQHIAWIVCYVVFVVTIVVLYILTI